mgnify:CR=1 FL=1
MARIILKSPYLKPNAPGHLANYTRYIATREGVQMPDNSKQYLSSTAFQQKTITELLISYPDSKELYEYEDYQKNPTRKNADDLILRIAESHGELFGTRQKYVDYIATRPTVEKLAEHGLFTDEGVPIVLSQAAKEISEHRGNVWTHIISLRREDAEWLGYNSVEQWQALLRSQRNIIAANMKIAPENFRWYAAFHNAEQHPHVHMMAFSVDPKEPYLTERGIHEIKASLAKEIFRQDLISIYEKQTEQRDALRQDSRKIVVDIVQQINAGEYNNPVIEDMLRKLSERLKNTTGKKVYGYLKKDIKTIIDTIVDELAKDDRIARLYDLWYEQRFEILHTYTDVMPDKLPLSQNKEFKSIKNAVIQEAMFLTVDRFVNDKLDVAQPAYSELLSESPEQGIHNQKQSSNLHVAESSIRLLYQLSKVFQNKLNDNCKSRISYADKKLKRQIQEKKQAHGMHME